jgi:tetratricopeptide (TPR) repeat protein
VSGDAAVASALAAIRDGRPDRAEAIAREALAAQPDSVDHLRVLARALLMQSRAGEAEAALRRGLELAPGHAPLHEDLGSVLTRAGRFAEAVASLRAALELDPGMPHAGKKLAMALAASGQGADADKAFESWFEQDPDRVYVAVALDHLRAGRREEAISNLQRALRANPDNVNALQTLAEAWWGDVERVSDVEAMLRRVTELAPAHDSAWTLLGTLLHDSERPAEAIACHERAVGIDARNVAAWVGLGAAYAKASEMEKSEEAYGRALDIEPKLPGIHMSRAHSLKTLGRQEEALREYRTAIAQKPEFGEAYWSMANLKVFRFEPDEVRAMEKQLEREDLSESAAIHLHFALGKAYEDAGDPDRAFAHYQAGNLRQRPLVTHNPVGFEVKHEQIAKVFSHEFLERHAGAGSASDAPIFIVGLPRSGSTLIEQVLASHSQVEGTLELPVLGDIAMATARYRRDEKVFPETVLDLRDRDFRACGEQYLEETRLFRKLGRPRFTDKLPNNFSFIGFAHLILPNAKVINARRHPLDSCLGNYKQLFGKGQHFTYDMQELGLYYRQYHDIMKHWHRVLPGKVLDVHYEDTVADLETQVRRILAHCGLPFEEACLRFHETDRPVRTASSEQVRQPLYTRALGTWRRYEKHLGLWQEDLADIIEELPENVRNAGL